MMLSHGAVAQGRAGLKAALSSHKLPSFLVLSSAAPPRHSHHHPSELRLLVKIKEDSEVAGTCIILGVERDVYSFLSEVEPLR